VEPTVPVSHATRGSIDGNPLGERPVVGDVLKPADVYRVVSGCRRVYFGMSVSAGYLEATVSMAAKGR
jgi:NAD(P)H dehydrogenase (quinone)